MFYWLFSLFFVEKAEKRKWKEAKLLKKLDKEKEDKEKEEAKKNKEAEGKIEERLGIDYC